MKIDGKTVGGNRHPYVIAELSGNHGGNIRNAFRLIREAKYAGADAIKTQCYEPDTITLNCKKLDFIVQDGLWRGRTLHELYSKAYTPFSWQADLFKCAEDVGLTMFASVFDFSSVDLLERLGCPAYKIASFEIVDIPLIEYAAQTGKPIIISTGMASDREINEANEASGKRAAFLHCTSEYPALVEHANLCRIAHIDRLLKFNNLIGLSDHTVGLTVPIAGTAMRIALLEKHLKLDDVESEDSEFSLTPKEFKGMVLAVHETWLAMQERPFVNPSRQLRRSLYAVKPIKKGEVFSMENVRSIRPGYGLPPSRLRVLLGKKAKKEFRVGDPIGG